MVKNNFAIIIDSFCLSFIVFILSFTWITRLINNQLTGLLYSFLISTFFFFIITSFFFKKNKKQKISKLEKNNLIKCKEQLKYNDIKTNIKFFEKLLSASFIKNNIYKNPNAYFYINIIGKMDSYDFYIANDFYKNIEDKMPLIFICDNFSDDFSAILKNSPIKFNIFLIENLYNIMQIKNIYPVNISNIVDKKTTISLNKLRLLLKNLKTKIIIILENTKFKSSFFSGLSLVFLSAFVPFSLYYLIIGSSLLTISFFSIFIKAKSKNIIQNQNINLEEICK